MSIFSLLTRPISIGDPKIWTAGHCLYAETSPLVHVLTLFAYRKTVKADSIKKRIEISTTSYWFKTTKTYVPFCDIEYIDIFERSRIIDPRWTRDGAGIWFADREPTIIYSVQVRSKNSPYPINLFKFTDDGRPYFNWFGVFIGMPQTEGPGQKKARVYAERLSAFTGAEVWTDRHIQFSFEQGAPKQCPECGHSISLNAKACMYCGYRTVQNKR